jgi:hypothetical protein
MRTFKFTFILLLLIGALSCKKDSTATTAVTTDQAADIAAGSLAENSYGLASISDNVAANAQVVASISTSRQTVNSSGAVTHQACGTTLADSLSNSGSGSSVTFSYFFKFARTLNCNSSEQPDNLANVLTYHGNFDGPRLTSANTGSATFTIAGLSPTALSFVINGEYKRTGSFQSKVGNDLSGNSNIDIVVTNLTLSKTTRKIASGSATISITGTTSKNGAFSYTGTLVFNGDGTATLTINGTAYNVDLSTGIKTKV